MVAGELLAFLSLERGGLHTTFRLLVSPGKTIRNYLDGKHGVRRRITNPLRYLAMSTALVTVAYVFFMPRDQFSADFELGQGMGAGMAEDSEEVSVEESTILAKTDEVAQLLSEIEQGSEDRNLRQNAREANVAMQATTATRVGDITLAWMNVFLLAALPLNTILTYVAFRRSGFNLAEHCAINAFVLGFQNVAAVCVLVPGSLGNMGISSAIYMLLSFTFQFIVWRQVFVLRGFQRNAWGFVMLLVSVFSYITLQGVATFAILWIAT